MWQSLHRICGFRARIFCCIFGYAAANEASRAIFGYDRLCEFVCSSEMTVAVCGYKVILVACSYKEINGWSYSAIGSL